MSRPPVQRPTVSRLQPADVRASGGRRGLAPSRELVAICALFCLSRLILVAVGIRFDVGPLRSAVQLVDPELLRTHLAQSLWYLHGQPPLWNALVGASLVVAPSHWPQLWHVVFLVLGLVQTLALFELLADLRLERRASAAVAVLLSVSPAMLLSENSFFYDYPTVVALTVTALAVSRFARGPTFGRATALFAGAAYLVLTRTLFQVWWMLALLALLLLVAPGHRRTLLLAASLPLALVVGVYVKSFALYGVPSTTSWTGMGVARAAVVALPLRERRVLVARGDLHPVSLVKPLAPLAAYEAVGIRRHAPTGIPLLDEVRGPEVERNLENRTYIEISREYWRDDLWIIEHRPGAYARSVGRGLADYFASPTLAEADRPDGSRLAGYAHWFDRVVYGRLGTARVGIFVVAAYVLALAFGIAVASRRLRPRCEPDVVVIAFATLTILYVTLAGNLAEVGENYRFRLVVDPLVLALGAAAALRLRRAGAVRWRRRASRPVGP